MSRCGDCIHYKICDPYVSPNESFPEVRGGCGAFQTNDLNKVVEELFSDLKKEIHNKAVRSYDCKIDPYISLKVLDGIIQNYINKYTEGKKHENKN